MTTLARTRIRIAGDAAYFDAPLDVIRRATPEFWRGNDVQFEVAVFFNSVLMDVSNLASMTLEIRPLGAGGSAPAPSVTPLMGATVSSFDDTTTLTTWNAGTLQQGLVVFTAAQSNIAAGPAWLSLFVVTNDSPGRVITLCAGPVRVLEDGSGLATTPEPAAETFYTAAQCDARFAPIDSGGTGTVTSVALTMPSIFSVGGSPVTSAGTLVATLATQSANMFFAGPASGSAVAPTFRALAAADLTSGLPAQGGNSGKYLTTDGSGNLSWGVPSGGGGGGGGTAWGSITGTLSSQSDLNTALSLLAPLASPSFTGGVNMAGTGTSNLFLFSTGASEASEIHFYNTADTSGNSLWIGKAGSSRSPSWHLDAAGDAYFSSDTNASHIIGTSGYFRVGSSDGTEFLRMTKTNGLMIGTTSPYTIGTSYNATITVTGGLAVSSSTGESAFVNGNTSGTLGGSLSNVLSLKHASTNGSASTRFLRHDGYEVGACGYQNDPGSGGWYGNNAVFLAATQPYDPNTGGESTSAPPCNLILGQEGAYSGNYYAVARLKMDTSWNITIQDPTSTNKCVIDPTGNFTITGSNANNTQVSVQNQTNGSNSVSAFYANNSSAAAAMILGVCSAGFTSSGPYQANGIFLNAYAAGGLALVASNGGAINFYTNADNSSSLRYTIDSSGNWIPSSNNATALFFCIKVNSTSNTGLQVTNANAGGSANIQSVASDGTTGYFAAIGPSFSYHAYPASGAWMGTGGSGGLMVAATNSSGIIKFLTGGDQNSNEVMRMTTTGRVGIGTTSPGYTLDVNGNINYSGSLTNTSDSRFKTSVAPLPAGALELVNQLAPVSYLWNAAYYAAHPTVPQSRQLGFLAQAVEKLFPELVQTGPDGYLRVEYIKFAPVLVAAIQELAGKVAALTPPAAAN